MQCAGQTWFVRPSTAAGLSHTCTRTISSFFGKTIVERGHGVTACPEAQRPIFQRAKQSQLVCSRRLPLRTLAATSAELFLYWRSTTTRICNNGLSSFQSNISITPNTTAASREVTRQRQAIKWQAYALPCAYISIARKAHHYYDRRRASSAPGMGDP